MQCDWSQKPPLELVYKTPFGAGRYAALFRPLPQTRPEYEYEKLLPCVMGRRSGIARNGPAFKYFSKCHAFQSYRLALRMSSSTLLHWPAMHPQ